MQHGSAARAIEVTGGWAGPRRYILGDARHTSGSRLLYVWAEDQAAVCGPRLIATAAMMEVATGLSRSAITSRGATAEGLPKGVYWRLVAMGLFEHVHLGRQGRYEFYVRGADYEAPRAVRGDPQQDLPLADTRGAATDRAAGGDAEQGRDAAPELAIVPLGGVPAPSASRAPPRTFDAKSTRGAMAPLQRKNLSCNHNHNHLQDGDGAFKKDQDALALLAAKVRAGCEREGRPDNPQLTGGTIDELLGTLRDPAVDLQSAEALAAWIEARIPDSGRGQALLAAQAVVGGHVDRDKLHEIMAFAQREHAAGRARQGLAGCFFGTFHKWAHRGGFHWPRKPKAK